MSKMKRLASLLLALALVLALGVSAFADGYTITINNETDGYTYVAYQIFAGDLYEGVLSNITWGSNITESVDNVSIYTALAAISTTDGDGNTVYPFKNGDDNLTSAAAVAEVLANYTSNSAVVNAFAEVVAKYVSGDTESAYTNPTYNEDGSVKAEGYYTISNLAAGYYLVVNTDVPSNASDVAYSDYILEVVKNVTVNTKADSVPTFDKTVGTSTDGDTTDDATEDYAIGDSVPFTLTATMASSYTAYTTYALTFHDTLSSGLTFNSSSVVVTVKTPTGTDDDGNTTYTTYTVPATTTVSGETVTNYTVKQNTEEDTSIVTDGCTFEVVITDTNSLKDENGDAITVTAGSIITVSYNATLDEDASSIENNTAKLEYSNNPNSDATGTTTEDKTYVVTFELDVTKTDEDGNALEGAQFELYKKANITAFESGVTYYTISNGVATEASSYVEGTTYYVSAGTYESGYTYVAQTDLTGFADGVTYYTKSDDAYTEVESTATFDSTATYYIKVQNTFAFDGLDVGDYVLIESGTPNGYNTIDPISFTITATAVEGADKGTATVTFTSPATGEGSSFTIIGTTISTTVENQSGSTLPSTGGIGTTIFYVIGSIMVLGAVVLLITRKRMSKAE